MAIGPLSQKTVAIRLSCTVILLPALLGLAASLSGCSPKASSKVSGTPQDHFVVLSDDDDEAPPRPPETDRDPLDSLNPNPHGYAENDDTTTTARPNGTPNSPLDPAQDTSAPQQRPLPDTTSTTSTPAPRPLPLPSESTPSPAQRPLPRATPVLPAPAPAPAPAPVPAPAAPETSRPAPGKAAPAAPPKAPIHGFWDEKVRDGSQWTSFALASLLDQNEGASLLKSNPKDINSFCPTYANLNKRQRADFWVKLVSALAALESDFDPNAKYTEIFADREGKRVISRGLLQISIESSQAYGCTFESVQALHDPKQNLSCAIRIIAHWIDADGRISGYDGQNWLGIGRYWHPFRTDSAKFEKIRALLRQVPVCQSR